MITIIYIFIFIFGAIIGSFLNVVINRYNTGMGISGRSYCPVCSKKLSWSELIPVFSFLMQKRKCIGCGGIISWQYPIVEITTGLLFLLIYNSQSTINDVLFYWLVMSILIVIVVYDFRHKIIPNGFVYTFIALSFFSIFQVSDFKLNIPNTWDLFAGPLLAAPFVLLWSFSDGRLMGLGDGKLALGIGWMLGIAKGISAMLIAFWTGAIVGIALLFLRRKTITMKSEIPFGPFLVLGTIIIFLFNINIVDYLLSF